MPDAAYVIEIASRVSGVDATTAELDSLSSTVNGMGAKSVAFTDAISRLEGQLDAAAGASAAANAALAAGRAHYDALVSDANKASKAVEKMESDLASAKRKVEAADAALAAGKAKGVSDEKMKALAFAADTAAANLKKAERAAKGLDEAKAAAASASAAVEAYAGDLDRLEAEAEDAAAAQAKLTSTLEGAKKLQTHVADSLGRTTANISTLQGALGDIGGPIGSLGDRILKPIKAFADLNEKFGTSTATAVVAGAGLVAVAAAAVVAVVAVTAALVAGVAALASYALAASDAARSMALTREAAAMVTPELAGIPWNAITDSTGVAEERLRDLSKSLLDAKVSAEDLPAALKAAAMADTAGGGNLDAFVAKLKEGKASAAELSAELSGKLGDVVSRRLLGLDAQGARFKRNVDGLFDFEIEPALEGLSVLVAMFDKNSSTGRAMRAALEGLLDPLIANARTAAYVVEAFAIGVATAALEMYIAVKPVVRAISDALGFDTSGWTLDDLLDGAAMAGKIALPIFVVVAGVLGALAAAVVVVVGVLTALSVVFMGVPVLFSAVVAAVVGGLVYLAVGVASAVGDAVSAVTGFVGGMLSAGADLIAGLVQGITSGASSVVSAITGVLKGGIDAAKSVLGIKSPSKVFGELGDQTVTGYVDHVVSGTPDVDSAVGDMLDPPVAAASPSAPSVSSSSSSTTTIVIEKLELPSVTDPAAFVAWLEGLAMRHAA